MPTYTKETALYDTGAIQSGIDGAAQTATSFITQITGGGIMVHPSGDSTSGWRIADALELIKSTVTAFSVTLVSGMAKVIVGEADKSHAEIDYHSLKMVDRDGETYFHVSDLRDGEGHMTDTFPARETAQNSFALRTHVSAKSDVVSVKVGGVEISDFYLAVGTGDSVSRITFSPSTTDEVEVTYTPTLNNLWKTRAYTIGTRGNDAVGMGSVVIGSDCDARGTHSHAEGDHTKAYGRANHAEGSYTTAGVDSRYAVTLTVGNHAEGSATTASGEISHAEGYGSVASSFVTHAEGDHTVASGNCSHSQNRCTIAAGDDQTAIGKYNVEDANDEYALIIGNGTNASNRSNAFTVDWDGNITINRIQDTLTLSNTSAGTATFVRNTIVASLFVRSLQLSSALANGSSVTIATVPSGYRPAAMAFAHVYNTARVFLSINTAGAVQVWNYSGASLPTSTVLSATITYVI